MHKNIKMSALKYIEYNESYYTPILKLN